jgi:transposase
MWAEIGDARRFASSDQLVRFAGSMSPSTPLGRQARPGHLSRQGSPELAVGGV